MPHRSPIIFWLLLAATLAVNLVAIFGQIHSDSEQALTFVLGLVYGQLGLLCVWAVADRGAIRVRWIVPAGAAVIFALILAWTLQPQGVEIEWKDVGGMVAFILLYVGLILGLLWFVVPTKWVSGRGYSRKSKRQFSTLHLLIAMTCVAVLLVSLRSIDDLKSQWFDMTTFYLANAILLLGVLAILQRPRHLLLRAAASLLLALTIGMFCKWTGFAYEGVIDLPVFIIQAVMLVVWLSVCLPAQDADIYESTAEPTLPLSVS